MSFFSASHSDSNELETEGVDCNASTTTASLYINGNTNVGLYVYAASGTHGTHVTTKQFSMDGSTWQDSTYTVAGTGFVEGTTVSSYIRAKITTVESASSTCDIHIASK